MWGGGGGGKRGCCGPPPEALQHSAGPLLCRGAGGGGRGARVRAVQGAARRSAGRGEAEEARGEGERGRRGGREQGRFLLSFALRSLLTAAGRARARSNRIDQARLLRRPASRPGPGEERYGLRRESGRPASGGRPSLPFDRSGTGPGALEPHAPGASFAPPRTRRRARGGKRRRAGRKRPLFPLPSPSRRRPGPWRHAARRAGTARPARVFCGAPQANPGRGGGERAGRRRLRRRPPLLLPAKRLRADARSAETAALCQGEKSTGASHHRPPAPAGARRKSQPKADRDPPLLTLTLI